jgi:hypothetical protein
MLSSRISSIFQLHFQRAHILYAIVNNQPPDVNLVSVTSSTFGRTILELLEEAVRELEIVKTIAPREPPVYAMLGQVIYPQTLWRYGFYPLISSLTSDQPTSWKKSRGLEEL